MTYKQRYEQLYQQDFKQRYPSAYAHSGFIKTTFPKTATSNGLTQFVIKFLTYSGYYANRISSTGRLIDTGVKQPSGIILQSKKWIRGNTQRGTADIHAIIEGRHVSIEIKIGRDQMSVFQDEEKEKVTKAGGVYWIVKTPDDFLLKFDNFIAKNKAWNEYLSK